MFLQTRKQLQNLKISVLGTTIKSVRRVGFGRDPGTNRRIRPPSNGG